VNKPEISGYFSNSPGAAGVDWQLQTAGAEVLHISSIFSHRLFCIRWELAQYHMLPLHILKLPGIKLSHKTSSTTELLGSSKFPFHLSHADMFHTSLHCLHKNFRGGRKPSNFSHSCS